MAAEFIEQDTHREKRRTPPSGGGVMLSNLPRGESRISCGALALKLVVEGEERYRIDGRVHRLRPGEVMVLGQAGAAVDVSVPSGDRALGLCVNIPIGGQLVGDSDADLHTPHLHMPVIDHFLGQWLVRTTALLVRRPQHGARLAPHIVNGVRSGLADFLSTTARRAAELSIGSPARRGEVLRRVENARAYLHAHPGRPVKLDELATVASLSPFHLARSFQAVHGLPPAAYHRRHRLDRAADLLSKGKHSPSQVAEDVGFADQASFSRAFARHHGITPGVARGTMMPDRK